ncbi:MAG: TolC family protein [Bacteroidota bacterium]|nr:TolC family protein [Bacteroidota bacterium]
MTSIIIDFPLKNKLLSWLHRIARLSGFVLIRYFKKVTLHLISCLLLLQFGGYIFGQELSIQSAVDSALLNNYVLKNARLLVKQSIVQEKSKFSPGQTDISYSYGELNASIPDTYLEIEQDFGNVVKQVRLSGESQALTSIHKSQLEQLEREISFDVKMKWQEWIYSCQKIKLLEKEFNILMEQFQEKKLKDETGEICCLNICFIETEMSKIRNASAIEKVNLIRAKKELLIITMIRGDIEPPECYTLEINQLPSDRALINSQLLNLQQARIDHSQKVWNTAKSDHFPDLYFSYFNQAISPEIGLQGFKVGIRVPLWFFPNQKATRSAKINIEYAQNEYERSKVHLNSEYENSLIELGIYLRLFEEHGENWEQQSKLLLERSGLQLRLGEIDQFVYVQSYRQALELQKQRIELINNLNLAIIKVEYFQP